MGDPMETAREIARRWPYAGNDAHRELLADEIAAAVAAAERAGMAEAQATIARLTVERDTARKEMDDLIGATAGMDTRAEAAEARLRLMDGQMPQLAVARRKMGEADALLKRTWDAWKPAALATDQPQEPPAQGRAAMTARAAKTTLEAMASVASVPMDLWNEHVNAVLALADALDAKDAVLAAAEETLASVLERLQPETDRADRAEATIARLTAQLDAIEADGTEEHNAAVDLRQSLARERLRAEAADARLQLMHRQIAQLEAAQRMVWDAWRPSALDQPQEPPAGGDSVYMEPGVFSQMMKEREDKP